MTGHDFDWRTGVCRWCGIGKLDLSRIGGVLPQPDMVTARLDCPGGPDTNIRQISVAISQRRINDAIPAYRPRP